MTRLRCFTTPLCGSCFYSKCDYSFICLSSNNKHHSNPIVVAFCNYCLLCVCFCLLLTRRIILLLPVCPQRPHDIISRCEKSSSSLMPLSLAGEMREKLSPLTVSEEAQDDYDDVLLIMYLLLEATTFKNPNYIPATVPLLTCPQSSRAQNFYPPTGHRPQQSAAGPVACVRPMT